MIGFKDAEGLCSNMLLSTKECLGERSDYKKDQPWQHNACPVLAVSWICLFTFSPFFHRLQVLECLSSQGLTLSVSSAIEGTVGSIGSMGSYSGTTSTSVIKARFRSFNKQFEEVCQTQINWAIPDRELWDNFILAVAEILSPAYRSFVKRFGPLVANSHNASKYMKYTPEALEQALSNLFAKKSLHKWTRLYHAF
jgi:hypothetical protein